MLFCSYFKLIRSAFSSPKKIITASENQQLDCQDEYTATLQNFFELLRNNNTNKNESKKLSSENLMTECFGFHIKKQSSKVAGQGVFVAAGIVKTAALVALYPGTVYYPMEPIFFQSIGNQFILKCKDGILIDGNDKGISKRIYKSSAKRDVIGSHHTCDISWLTNDLKNPLAIGQYINNANKTYPANVCYQEIDIPISFALPLMKFIPNVHFKPQQYYPEIKGNDNTRFIRTVGLIALRDITVGEELFSSYFTEVYE